MKKKKQQQNFSKHSRSFKIPFTATPDIRNRFLHVQTTGIIYTKPDYYLKRDTLDGMLLLTVLKGRGRLVYEGQSYDLSAGSLFLIDCREYHELYSSLPGPMIFCFLHFSGPQARSYTRSVIKAGGTVSTITKQDAVLVSMRQIILILKRNDPAAVIRCSGLIHEILTEMMLRTQISFRFISNPPGNIQRVLMYMEENYYEDLTLEDLAGVGAVSKYHFTRLFKKYYGQSAYDYLLSFRLNKAKTMLLNTSRPVTIISEDCGFRNLSHFSRSFKRRENISPHEYRKHYRASERD